MRVVDIKNFEGTERDVYPSGCRSIRPVVASDNMGFSIHKTIIPKGDPNHWHYPHHLETCYCISGHGILTDMETGNSYDIVPDTVYSLDNHDNHLFQAIEDTVLISVFNPPISLSETHDNNGNYPPSKYVKEKAKKILDICNNGSDNYSILEDIIDVL